MCEYFYKKIPQKTQEMEQWRWDISQFIFENLQNDVFGTAVSWFLRYLGVSSNAEKVIFCFYRKIFKKATTPKTGEFTSVKHHKKPPELFSWALWAQSAEDQEKCELVILFGWYYRLILQVLFVLILLFKCHLRS